MLRAIFWQLQRLPQRWREATVPLANGCWRQRWRMPVNTLPNACFYAAFFFSLLEALVSYRTLAAAEARFCEERPLWSLARPVELGYGFSRKPIILLPPPASGSPVPHEP